MGTWGTTIEGNDTFLDIYDAFMDRYNSGQEPMDIKQDILVEFKEEFENADTANNALFGLGKALWEIKALDSETLNKIKSIIESGEDLRVWQNLGADHAMVQKRGIQLGKFLIKISTEKSNPRKRRRRKADDQ